MDMLKIKFGEFEQQLSGAFKDSLVDLKSLKSTVKDLPKPKTDYTDLIFKGEKELLALNLKNLEFRALKLLENHEFMQIRSIVDKVSKPSQN